MKWGDVARWDALHEHVHAKKSTVFLLRLCVAVFFLVTAEACRAPRSESTFARPNRMWYSYGLGKGPIVEGLLLEIRDSVAVLSRFERTLYDNAEYVGEVVRLRVVERSGEALVFQKGRYRACFEFSDQSAILFMPGDSKWRFVPTPPNYDVLREEWEKMSGESVEAFLDE